MAKFNDSEILKLLVNRINELYESMIEGFDSHDLNIYDAGRRSVLDSLSSSLTFYQNYEFDD